MASTSFEGSIVDSFGSSSSVMLHDDGTFYLTNVLLIALVILSTVSLLRQLFGAHTR